MADDTARADSGAGADARRGRVRSTSRGELSVVVSAAHLLVAESVQEALAARGLEARAVAWPDPTGSEHQLVAPTDPVPVGVVLAELESEDKVAELGRLVRDVRARWLLLTRTRPGPLWGAALEQGVDVVCPSSITLDDLVVLIELAAAGRTPLGAEPSLALRAAWRDHLARETDMHARMRSLSPRESWVLAMLYGGQTVIEIASELEVSEATVRTHVRAILRKLALRSQLSAVAAFAEFLDEPARAGSSSPVTEIVVPRPRRETGSGDLPSPDVASDEADDGPSGQ